MQHPNELMKSLGGMAAEKTAKSIFMDDKDTRKQSMQNEVMMILLVLLLFVGAEGMKILFRTNFGSKSISMLRIGLCSLIFFLWGAIPLGFFIAGWNDPSTSTTTFLGNSGGVFSMILVAIFYWTLAFRIFALGSKERAMSKVSDRFMYDSGDSVFFGYLEEKGISKMVIQIGIEPLFIIGVGFLLGGINVLLGAPLIICGISLILYQLYESFVIGNDNIYNTLSSRGIKNDENYSDVVL